MIARVWNGVVPLAKADGYAKYLSDSDLGVHGYQSIPGNRGVCLARRVDGERVHFLLISFWDSREAIARYAGPAIERAQYFPFDLECLLEPQRDVAHFEVLIAPEPSV